MSRVGRNDPCPCGSGKKYKRCCLAAATSLQRHPIHSVDEELVVEILKFAGRRFGEAWFQEAEDVYAGRISIMVEEQPFMLQWWIYHHVLHDGGAPLADLFLEAQGARLEERRRRWIEAQKEAWLSLWEVLTLQPELGTVQLRDLLSGEERRVHDLSMAVSARPLGAFLGRVVDFDGASLLCGSHPSLLTPLQAQEVVEMFRAHLGMPSGSVPSAVLREPDNVGALLSMWRAAVDAAMHPGLPRLSNSDGDPLEWTEDVFAFDPAFRHELLQRLSSLGTLDEREGETAVSFVREGNRLSPALTNTSLGRAVVSGDGLRIESNSTNRADALRRQVEAAGGDLLRFTRRTQKPFDQMLREPHQAPQSDDSMENPAVQAALKQHKQGYYQHWLDAPVPAIGGLTPRAAARDADQRPRLRALVKEIELRENQQDHRQRVDLSFLWKELDLER